MHNCYEIFSLTATLLGTHRGKMTSSSSLLLDFFIYPVSTSVHLHLNVFPVYQKQLSTQVVYTFVTEQSGYQF